ncbi:MAG: type I DNA topoisomerase [Gemmatimonadota bacterium]|nr:MAG: type I DNA topoisomerase [Gemmatimonadota bacterium]
MKLVIVESPAKARTIGRYLGSEYEVAASVGHVRDLPPKELGVDVENGFTPKYVTIRGKGKILQELKKRAKGAEAVILATDPDREGEAIAYHVAEQLGWETEQDRFQRVTFHEITKLAVQGALEAAGPIDMQKVEAQQARRILDRLVGYQVSPFLWKPIRPGLSAGRVQTVALRLLCERDDEINAFESEEYWSIVASLIKDEQAFEAKLQKIDGKAFRLENEAAAQAVVAEALKQPFRVADVKRRERRKNPAPPFTTSTLQQAAAKRLRFSAKRTMTLAQRLYEGLEVRGQGAVGLITYMRTDSTRVSKGAVLEARSWIEREVGKPYVADSARFWGGKQQKGAQDAHEAIRPTNVELHPSEVGPSLDPGAARLYELIWQRFVASQMAPAVYDTTTIDFDIRGDDGRAYLFRSTGSVVKFEGFTRLYLEANEAGDHRRLDDLDPLPAMEKGDEAEVQGIVPNQHFTQPPPRFSEASLVKELERLGIGRPSTYAQIISTIQDRGYVDLEERRFYPTPLGDTVSKLLVRVFPDIFDVEFTSRMEGELDRVEDGELDWQGLLAEFYPPFKVQLEAGEARSEEIIKELLAAEGETCEICGRPMQVRWNRFGRFLGCSGYPDCKSTRALDAGARPEENLGVDAETGLAVLAKVGPYGPYVQLGEAEEGKKPKRASLPKGKTLEDVDLEYALKLLRLPRELGKDPESGEEVVAGLGRYGPFVRRGKTFASLTGEDQMFSVELEEAVNLLNEKKGGRAVIRELGPHPDSGEDLVILSGRYGPYVTDGKLNASLRKGTEPEEVTMEAAVELLVEAAERKKRGGGRGGRRRKSS